jgi:hypothetical protein
VDPKGSSVTGDLFGMVEVGEEEELELRCCCCWFGGSSVPGDEGPAPAAALRELLFPALLRSEVLARLFVAVVVTSSRAFAACRSSAGDGIEVFLVLPPLPSPAAAPPPPAAEDACALPIPYYFGAM